MKIVLASLLLAACGSAESPKLPTIEAAATPTPTPTATPTASPTPSSESQASDVAYDNSEALYALAKAQWKSCSFNAILAACGRQPGTFSSGWERCKVNHTLDCGSEPVLTDFQ